MNLTAYSQSSHDEIIQELERQGKMFKQLYGNSTASLRAIAPVPRCEWVLPNKQTIHLNRPSSDFTDSSVELFLHVAGLTNAGRELVQRFYPLWRERKTKVLGFSEKILPGTLPETRGEYDVHNRTIYLNKDLELGLLLPVFIHELTHALDDEFHKDKKERDEAWEIFQNSTQKVMFETAKRLNKDAQDLKDEDYRVDDTSKLLELYNQFQHLHHTAHFKTERKAFTIEHKFTRELMGILPCYRAYLSAHQISSPTDEEIIRNYGLDRSFIRLNK